MVLESFVWAPIHRLDRARPPMARDGVTNEAGGQANSLRVHGTAVRTELGWFPAAIR
jgi:hypothetical protein